MNLVDIYKTFQPKTTEYILLLSAKTIFSRINHTLGHKTNLNKFKKTEIISLIFSDHNDMLLEISYKKTVKLKKNPQTC